MRTLLLIFGMTLGGGCADDDVGTGLDSEMLLDRATHWYEKGEFKMALWDLDEAVRLAPENPVAWYNRASVKVAMEDYEGALSDCIKAGSLDPNESRIVALQAHCSAHLGKYEQAIEGYKKAIESEPDEYNHYLNLAWLYAACPDEGYRNAEKAMQNAQRAAELTNWEDPFTLESVAGAHAEAGEFQEAIKRQKQAIEVAPDHIKDEFRTRLELYEANKPYRGLWHDCWLNDS